jgi:hypothetical protein
LGWARANAVYARPVARSDAGDLLKVRRQRREIRLHQLAQQRGLVGEMVINRRRRVLHALGDHPHGHRVIALDHEQLARRVEDLGPDGERVAFPAFGW